MEPAAAACSTSTSILCSHLAQQFAADSTPHHATLLLARCKELAACRAFKRGPFLAALAQCIQQLQPLQLVQLLTSLARSGLFGLPSLLSELLPDPQQAADTIHQAACSQAVCLALIHGSGAAQAQGEWAAHKTHCAALESLLQLLQALLVSVFDTAALAASEGAAAAAHTAAGGAAGLRASSASGHDPAEVQYVTAVLHHLQEAAAQHEVLGVCLLQAAARTNIVCSCDVVTRWATEQLQRHLATNLSAAPSPPGPAAAPPASAHPLAGSSWPSLALQQPRLLVPAALQCMPWAGVLGVALTQETVITAAGSVTGVACMCEMLAALGACGYRSEVVATLGHGLAAALQGGHARSTVAHLLLAGHMLATSYWSTTDYAAVLQPVAVMEGHAGTGVVSGVLKAFNMLLPTTTSSALQVQVEFLQRLRPQLGPLLQGEASNTEGMLRDVLGQQQKISRQEQLAKQGGKTVGQAACQKFNQDLDQYMQSAPDAQGRRLTQVQVAKWKLIRAAPDFCEAFTQQPPSALDRAQAALAYMQELQMHKLCKPEHVEAFRASCLAYGLDLSAQPVRARGAPAAPADPVSVLQSMLDRLPVVLASGSCPGLTTLLARITQQVKDLLQPSHAQQQHQQQHQHQQQQQELQDSTILGPAPKRQRPTEAPSKSSDSTCANPQEVLDKLLTAYAGASGSAAAGQDAGWDWRLEFLGVLQELRPLHGPLMERLLGALTGAEAGAVEVAPQQAAQALWHGSLLAWLSGSKLQLIHILAPQADAAVTTGVAASPLFAWCTTSKGSSRGCELVQYLISCTCLDTAHARCCAASFWAGYVGCIKTSMRQWCAGPQGPFGSAATAGISPGLGTLTALTQQPTMVDATAGGQQQAQLVAYVPPQLISLLRQLVSTLTADTQLAAAGGVDGVAYDVVASALQVCTRALRAPAAKWVCQLYGV